MPTYGGSLKVEELIEWIETISNHFENQVKKDTVMIAKVKLKGSALPWWNYIQERG